jgi:signal transduction histidine kinase
MEAVGRLTGGVAHDFNNILTVVMGNLELYELTDDKTEKKELLTQTRQAAARAADLTSQLLAFSRQSPLSQGIHDVTEIFSQVKSLSERLLPANIDFKYRVTPHAAKIRADGTQLEVALLNLVINARDAMPNGGAIDLAAHNIMISEQQMPNKAGHYLCIELSDEGEGIPDDIIEKVVEPFFTTKPVGKGSGLGLSMVKGFAEQSGGFLKITTDPGHSTTVAICLPAADDAPVETLPTAKT